MENDSVMEYHVNIGSNMGNREENLRRAVEALRSSFGDLRLSEVMESEPWGFDSDVRFLNQGVSFRSDMDPEKILDELQGIEKELSGVSHRNRDGSYRDREVDIDIVDREGEPYSSLRLQIPHPHKEEREFFLRPLAELRNRGQIIIRGRNVILTADGFPNASEVSMLTPAGAIFRSGAYDGWQIGADAVLPAGFSEVDIRESWRLLGDEKWSAVGRVAELCYWDRETRCCGRCGAKMSRCGEIMKKCDCCGTERFPRLSPAVVVLVLRGEEGLLVHGGTLRGNIHALVAGFVECGESLEECVVREVREETGLEISDVRYYGSQSWPFPGQLMVAFTARWRGGEPRWVDGELNAGGFFRRDALPELPSLPSLSRRLIDAWIAGRVGKD